MIGLIKSEFRKISSTRMTAILLVSSLLLTATYVVMYALLAGFDNGTGQTLPPLTEEMSVRMVFSSLGSSYVIVLVFGIIGFTQELRYRTATLTYLISPHRGQVIFAKFVAHAVWVSHSPSAILLSVSHLHCGSSTVARTSTFLRRTSST